MPDDHEDYETGAAPAAHKVSHQDGGTDEISVAGLAGVPAELAAHALLPSIHHLRYTDVEAAAAAAALILIHKNDAVAHQDAPQLILDHKGDASAHHAKYTDGEADARANVQIGIHALLPSIHHIRFSAAEARAAINNIFGSDGKADADIDLDTHKLINVVDPVTDQGGDTKKARNQAITDHTGVATAHQDAPTLIENHRLVAGAHHAKYTDADARASINSIFGADGKADADIDLDTHKLKNVGDITSGAVISTAPDNVFDLRVSGVAVGTAMLYRRGAAAKWSWNLMADNSLRLYDNVGTGYIFYITPGGNFDLRQHDGATKGLKLAGNLVTYGPDDSGGAGFKLLRVPN